MSEATFSDSPISNVMLGMNILGSCAVIDDKQSAEIATFVLTGKFDKELLHLAYWRENAKAAENDELLKDPKYHAILERIKSFIRYQIQGIFDAADRHDREQQREMFTQMVADMKDSSKPHPMGTVAQLATRFGVSKSEIRRRRTDGTLNDFIMEKTNTSNS